ncbi:MAG: glycerate kinase [Clostridia bacterium]|nr:glycerate kinase [Clostridia bacterium]
MKIVVAMDSFKGSLSTSEAGEAVAEGLRAACPEASVTVCPLADGGEGTVEAVLAATGGRRVSVWVTGPLGEPVEAVYGVLPDSRTAVMEMSAAAGLPLVPDGKRDPMHTTTYGVGELIRHALCEEGCERIVMGLGGSATNDGGVGMLEALGFAFLDREGRPIPRGAAGLGQLASVKTEGALPQLARCELLVPCDVQNPLCGERGCSAVYAPQKGATAEDIVLMDGWLSGYARLTEQSTGRCHGDTPGAGAAGGMGFACLSYLNGQLRSGISLVMETVGLEAAIAKADLVITGEGRLDGQSLMGKTPVGVATLAKKHGKTVVALCGCVTEDAGRCHEGGIDAFFPILGTPCPLAQAMDRATAHQNLKRTAEEVLRLIRAGRA